MATFVSYPNKLTFCELCVQLRHDFLISGCCLEFDEQIIRQHRTQPILDQGLR